MNDSCFFDTNIIVYAHDKANPEKQKIAKELLYDGLRKNRGAISTQVLSEFFVTVTKKLPKPLPLDVARKEIQLLRMLTVVRIEVEMIIQAIDLHHTYQISYWDALIITAAMRARCNTLFSEDLNDGQKFNNVVIRNPFSKLL